MSSDNKSLALANIISLFHTVVIVFVLIAPFSKIPAVLLVHIIFSLSILLHWYNNSNVCSLSVIESKLRGLESVETFSHRCISPIYDFKLENWNIFVWIVAIILLSISMYRLYTHENFKKALACYNNLDNWSLSGLIKCMEFMLAA